MVMRINIDAIPNQSFTVRLDDSLYAITLKATNGVMAADIARDNVQLLTGHRVVAGTALLPYKFQERGNFVITTIDEELPDYTKFGVSQFLDYLSVEEMAAIRAED